MVHSDEFNAIHHLIHSDDNLDINDCSEAYYESIVHNMSSDETTLQTNQEQSTFDIPELVHYTHQIPTNLINHNQSTNEQNLLSQILENTQISVAVSLHSNGESRQDNLYLVEPLDLNELDPSIVMVLNEYAEEA